MIGVSGEHPGDGPKPRASSCERVDLSRGERGIEASAEELGLTASLVPFLCECEEERCMAIVRLAPPKYVRVRRMPKRFLVAPGHEIWARPRHHRTWRFTIVEKTGEEGRLVARDDPRS